ncbi:MAG: hypothetical protein PVH63_12500 [Balneolaceae bacterium]
MKKFLLLLLLTSVISLGGLQNVLQAQSIELVAGNTLNGAMNGVLLGGATMALQNSSDYEPVRVGLGAGTLFGIGVGVYDVSQISKGQQFYISGTFNDGTNTSILVLLDTIYGAAGGAIIASSASLIVKQPIVEALQYGSGTGAWIGFGFGLIDAFMFAKGPNYTSTKASLPNQRDVNGFLTYSNSSHSVRMGIIGPSIIQQKELTAKKSFLRTYHPSLNIIHLKVGL